MSIFKHEAYSAEGFDREELLFMARCMESRIKELEKDLRETQDCWANRYYPISFVDSLFGQVLLDNSDIAEKALSKFYELYKDRDLWGFDVDTIDMIKGAINVFGDSISETEYQKLIDLKISIEKE